MQHSRGKKVQWTRVVSVQHEMLTATGSQSTAMRSPSFLLIHGRLEPSTKPSHHLGPCEREPRASLEQYGCFLTPSALLLSW